MILPGFSELHVEYRKTWPNDVVIYETAYVDNKDKGACTLAPIWERTCRPEFVVEYSRLTGATLNGGRHSRAGYPPQSDNNNNYCRRVLDKESLCATCRCRKTASANTVLFVTSTSTLR